MSITGTCQYCGNASLEGLQFQEDVICTSCGAVIQQGTFFNETAGASVAFQPHAKPSNGLKEGLAIITNIASQLDLSQRITKEAKDFYKTCFQKISIKHLRIEKKKAVAASCLYIVLRRNKWPGFLKDICTTCGLTSEEFSAGYSVVRHEADIRTDHVPIEDKVRNSIAKMGLGSEENIIIKRTLDIIDIAEPEWMTSGRPVLPSIVAATFISWKSMSPKRAETKFKKFCALVKQEKTRAAVKRFQELETVLIRRGKNICWLGEELTSNNISCYVEKIIKYKNDLKVESCEVTDTEVSQSDANTNARCIPDRRKDDLTECDLEISDSEIDSYIRSPLEIERIRKLREIFLPSENTEK